jgi:hypothetical protein
MSVYNKTMKHEKYYTRELEPVGKYKVWLVQGEYIRKDIDENFVGYDEHYHLTFIPKYEFWIDESTDPSEHQFFIDHLVVEAREMEKGRTYEEASKKADGYEKKERAKALHIKTRKSNVSPTPDILGKIHIRHLKEFSNKINIWLVDGKAVRDYVFVEYAEGGHDVVYSFIPEYEIWIENTLSPLEQKFIILHELHERFLMSQGKDYPHAHRGATQVEDYYRDHPDETEARIKKELHAYE